MPTRSSPPENQGRTGYPTLFDTFIRHPTATRKGATGVGNRGSRRTCPVCNARVFIYDYDHNLRVYMGPVRVDPTPLTLELATACRITRRNIYHHTRDLLGRHQLARIHPDKPIPPGGHVLPEHLCGGHIPTTLPPVIRTAPTPVDPPF